MTRCQLSSMDGITATREIMSRFPVPIVVISAAEASLQNAAQ